MGVMLKHFGWAVRHYDANSLLELSQTVKKAAHDMLATVRTELEPLARRNPKKRHFRPSLEALERNFISLREEAEMGARNAGKATARGRRRRTRKEKRAAANADSIAVALADMTRIAARALRAEVERRGAWNEKWARELGLFNWL